MQRADGGADATATAAAATVAPLLQLKRAAMKANKLARFARAVELLERAIAAAELAQPHNSLVIAALLNALQLAYTRILLQARHDTVAAADAMDAGGVALVRSLFLLHARWQAGTLFAPTAEEIAYLVEDEYPCLPAQLCGAYFYIHVAKEMVKVSRVWKVPLKLAVNG